MELAVSKRIGRLRGAGERGRGENGIGGQIARERETPERRQVGGAAVRPAAPLPTSLSAHICAPDDFVHVIFCFHDEMGHEVGAKGRILRVAATLRAAVCAAGSTSTHQSSSFLKCLPGRGCAQAIPHQPPPFSELWRRLLWARVWVLGLLGFASFHCGFVPAPALISIQGLMPL